MKKLPLCFISTGGIENYYDSITHGIPEKVGGMIEGGFEFGDEGAGGGGGGEYR